ncbi:MAG: hypothetical protein R3F28_12205 [Candidatus Kapaibacterium sp.]
MSVNLLPVVRGVVTLWGEDGAGLSDWPTRHDRLPGWQTVMPRTAAPRPC